MQSRSNILKLVPQNPPVGGSVDKAQPVRRRSPSRMTGSRRRRTVYLTGYGNPQAVANFWKPDSINPLVYYILALQYLLIASWGSKNARGLGISNGTTW